MRTHTHIHTHPHAHTHTHARTYTHMYTHTHMHIHTHTHAHTHTHTHIHTRTHTTNTYTHQWLTSFKLKLGSEFNRAGPSVNQCKIKLRPQVSHKLISSKICSFIYGRQKPELKNFACICNEAVIYQYTNISNYKDRFFFFFKLIFHLQPFH